jgi:uncharacterized membrane protein YgdD (TMEM256/DUF423 family)
LGGLSVAVGAFGAHALKDILIKHNRVDTFELAVRYQFFHAMLLIILSLLMDKFKSNGIKTSAAFIMAGVLLFSGSLYIMALFNTTQVALITPVGGVSLLIGWGLLTYSVWTQRP